MLDLSYERFLFRNFGLLQKIKNCIKKLTIFCLFHLHIMLNYYTFIVFFIPIFYLLNFLCSILFSYIILFILDISKESNNKYK